MGQLLRYEIPPTTRAVFTITADENSLLVSQRITSNLLCESSNGFRSNKAYNLRDPLSEAPWVTPETVNFATITCGRSRSFHKGKTLADRKFALGSVHLDARSRWANDRVD